MKIRIIKEAKYGITSLASDLESWANRNMISIKKISSEKKPGPYGASISNTFYQVGDKFALLRYETVTGAPRLNQLRFAIFDKPDLSTKPISVENYVEDFGYIQNMLEKLNLKGGSGSTTSAKTWTKKEIDTLVRDLVREKRYTNFNDDEAFEMAQSILANESGLEDAIKNVYGVTDVVGWLADKI